MEELRQQLKVREECWFMWPRETRIKGGVNYVCATYRLGES